MIRSFSPLRYPGGKGAISGLIKSVLKENGFNKSIFFEPFAGGAGVAINLLFSGNVERIILNDKERGLYFFWDSILHKTEQFIEFIENYPVSIEEYHKQKEKFFDYCNRDSLSESEKLEFGFSTFYMNRCNWSGVLTSGPIGGYSQESRKKIDCRFNKKEIIKKIIAISEREKDIEIICSDAIEKTSELEGRYKEKLFIFFDPPYYEKGKVLYKQFYENDDHKNLESLLLSLPLDNWCLTYNDCKQIRDLYSNKRFNIREISIDYAVKHSKQNTELFISGNRLMFPSKKEKQLLLF